MPKSEFTAIGVGQGDAFLLQKGIRSVLVDGGRSALGFPTQFRNATAKRGVDTIICTHNDSDHALGVLGFLRGGLRCREVWLPSAWADRLIDVLIHPQQFTEELISNIADLEAEYSSGFSLQSLGNKYFENVERKSKEEDVTSADNLSQALEKTTTRERHNWELFWPYRSSWLLEDSPYLTCQLYYALRRNNERIALFVEALSAASLIREITLEAYHRAKWIRWFEYDRSVSSGGIPGFLVPLNAREVVRMRCKRWTALEFLALTTANEQSLVFLSPESDEGPAVLFTADSSLSFSQTITWSQGMIITAPHHGSENNADAYKKFIRETKNPIKAIWVRSDGRYRIRPGTSYLRVHGRRFCTLCRNSKYPKQDIHLICSSDKWRPILSRGCHCV
jgi:hypothetical protein